MPQILNFRTPSELPRWTAINDGVMGGKSKSTLKELPGGAAFQGTVSAENGGGFASIRSTLREPLATGLEAVSVRVRGDGKRYQFRIRTDDRSDSPSYVRAFDTQAGAWQEIVLPLNEFHASFRGRALPNFEPLNSRDIQQIGFLIANEQYGRFELEIDTISIL